MTHSERSQAVRLTLSELQQAQMAAALRVAELQELMATDDPAEVKGNKLPRLEEGSYCVWWKRRRCHLGHTVSFRLFGRLLRRTNHFVSYDHLFRDVWADRIISPQTVRSAVRQLKAKLIRAKMQRLAASIQGQGQHYGLILRCG